MSKKKPTSKKHKFKHVDPASVGGAAQVHEAVVPSSVDVAKAPPARVRQTELTTDTSVRFAYVGRDVRRILTVAVVLVAFEIVLYDAISRTPFGDMVYRAISF